jgi:RNA polymerase sigma-70 factor (ECF subfamily)
MDIVALLCAARSGSDAAFDRLVEAVRPYLQLLAEGELPADVRAKVGASDLVQETLALVHRGFDRFRGRTEAEFRAWLGQILAHQATNAVNRYRSTAKRRLGREVPLEAAAAGPGGGLCAPGETPSRELLRREEWELMDRAFTRLGPDDQMVIQRRHRDGLSFAAIAVSMGRSEEAVRRLWARALQRWQREVAQLNEPA